MDINFKFSSTPTILFGVNKIKHLPNLMYDFGNKALIVTGKASFMKSFVAIELFQDLDFLQIENKIIHIENEPTSNQIDKAVREFRTWQPNVIVAIGGGSVIDAGKAIAAMLHESGSITNYLEGVGTKIPSGNKTPMIAVPTTAGTGSEATKNAVISQKGEICFKKSLRHENYIPNIAVVDPSLTIACPPSITAASGMDAFTQLLESYVSTNNNIFTANLAYDGLGHLIRSIENAVQDGSNIKARSDISYAATLSGIALANSGLGVVHGFAQPLGSMFSVPHGIVCGSLMGAANRITVKRLREKDDVDTLTKYLKIAHLISNERDDEKAVDCLLDFIDELIIYFNFPRLSSYGIKEDDFPEIIKNTSLKYHPFKLNSKDLEWILHQRI